MPNMCRDAPICWVQGRPLVERLKGGIGQFLGITDGRQSQLQPQPQQQLVGAKLQGEAREALIAALAVSTASASWIARRLLAREP